MDANTLGYVRDVRFRELVSKQDNELIKVNVYSAIKLTKTGEFLLMLKVWRFERPTNWPKLIFLTTLVALTVTQERQLVVLVFMEIIHI